jgi:predicted MFS family arabinose efflux permease
VPVLFLKEDPPVSALHPRLAHLLVGWLTRLRSPGMLSFIALIFCYRYGDQMVTPLLSPFLTDQGLTTEQIAMMKGTLGSSASLVGAALGGWLAFSAGRRTAILASGIAQALCFSLYIVAAFGSGGVNLLWAATIAEGVIGTMATVALFTLMMDASHPEHAGTDYTLLASSVVLVSNVGGISGGALADAIGYAPTFIIGTVLALAGCLLVVRVLDRNASPARVAEVWNRKPTKIT